jgi:hypothetical protein
MNGDIALRLCRLTATAGRSILILFLICLSTAIASERGGNKPDSTRTTIDLRLDSVVNPVHYPQEFTVAALYATGTADVTQSYGGALILDYMRFSPLVLRGAFQCSKLRATVADVDRHDVVAFEIDADALIHASGGRMRPYVGAGLTYYSNSSPLKEGPKNYGGPYDEMTPISYDFGSGFAAHVRCGVKVHVVKAISLYLDARYSATTPQVEYEVITYPSYERFDRKSGFDMDRLCMTVGLTFTRH